MTTEAGWYPDPDDATQLRYWDGTTWTEHRHPVGEGVTDNVEKSDETGMDATVPRPVWEPAPPAPIPPSAAEETSKKKPILIVLILLVIAALIGGGLFWLLRDDDSTTYTWGGVDIADPDSTIEDADTVFAANVAERSGATVDDSRCYFAQSTDEDAEHPDDVGDEVICGPVLFIDDDADGAYIGFPLDGRENDDGDIELTVGDEPSSPRPGPIGRRVTLTRPDGAQPPDNDGDIEAPEAPQASAGLVLVGDDLLDDLRLEDASILVVGRTKSVELTGLATPSRIGTYEHTRRAASGERFIAFELVTEPGDPYFGSHRDQLDRFNESRARIRLDVDGETTVLAIDDDAELRPIRAVVSVPEDVDQVDLVFRDSGVEQRISLLTGEPGEENLAVLARANRDVEMNETVTVPGVITFPDGQSTTEDFTITVRGVGLLYYVTDAPDRQPSSPSNAFLVVQHFVMTSEIVEEDGIALEPGHMRLNTDDFEYGPVNLAARDGQVLIAFEVPADFTTGTLTIHGEAPSGDIVVQFPEPAQIDIEIAAG